MAFTFSGRTIDTQREPLERGGTTYVPVAEIVREMGATVDWNNESKQAEIRSNTHNVRLDMASESADVNGRPVRLSGPVFVMDGTLYVPIDFFQTVYGYTVTVNDGNVEIS